MKTKFITYFALAASLTFNACKNDDDIKPGGDISGDTFLLYSRIGSYPDQADLIAEITRQQIEDPGYTFTLLGNGAEVQEKLTYGLVVKDGYFYCVSKDQRFGKYKVENGELIAEKEVPYAHLYNNFSFAWKDSRTLVIFGPDADYTKLIYSEINSNTLEMINGEIEMPELPAGFDDAFFTYGAAYRDGLIYLGYRSRNMTTTYEYSPGARMLVIDANSYQVTDVIADGTTDWFGESGRFQPGQFMDENNDIYFLGGKDPSYSNSRSKLLRIKSGTSQIDPTYTGYEGASNSTLKGVWYLGNGKAIIETFDFGYYDDLTSFPLQYHLLDLNSGSATPLNIPPGDASSTMNVAVDAKNDKAYILSNINRELDNNIYIYTLSTGAISKGMAIPSGYTFLLRLDYME